MSRVNVEIELLAELHGVLGREKFAKDLQILGLTATQIVAVRLASGGTFDLVVLRTEPDRS